MISKVKARIAPLALIAMLGGCGQPADRQAPPSLPNASSGRQEAKPALSGEWQIAAIDGRTVVGYVLDGDNDALTWKPACAGWSAPYRQDGAKIRFVPRERPPEEMQIVCSIGYPDRLPEIFQMLPAFNRIERVDDMSVLLSGGSRSMLLERLRSATERPVRSLAGRWSVSSLDGAELAKGSLRFDITDDLITWLPACAGQKRQYVIENTRIAVRGFPDAVAPPPPPGAQTTLPPPVCAIGLHPSLEAAFTAMEAATHVLPVGAGGVMLEGGGHKVILLSENRRQAAAPVRP